MNNTEPIDFMALVMVFVAFLTNKEIAAQIGPYATIVILSCAGAGYSLSESETVRNRTQTCWYVLYRVGLAFFFSVTIAKGVQHFFPWAEPIYTVVPVAFCIGLMDTIKRWVSPYWDRIIDKWLPPKSDTK